MSSSPSRPRTRTKTTRPRRFGRPPASSPRLGPSGGAEPGSNRPRTVFLGSGAFGRDSLAVLAAAPELELVGVVTAPSRPAGRGKHLVSSPIELAARRIGVEPILTPARLRAPDSLAAILALDPALVVLTDYGQLVPTALLDLPLGALNLHPSLLPRHRGASPIPATILAGDERTGVTLMRMDAGLDTGPIVATREVALAGSETAPALEERLATLAAELLRETLRPWIGGEIAATPQPATGATLTRPLRREDGRLDPDRSAAILERQVRAYQPWPGSWIETEAGRLVVWRASIAARDAASGGGVRGGGVREGGVPGALAAVNGRLVLATADGILEIEEAQLPGGRRMPVADLLRGHGILAQPR